MQTQSELWAIVLAGGSGKRLEPLTSALYGAAVPKQFAAIAGQQTLLTQTLARTARLVPESQIVVVATQTHAALARREQNGFPAIQLVLQPSNLDTGIGILVGLTQVLARSPDARVLVLPSDHYVRDESRFLSALSDAAICGATCDIALALVGVRPQAAEREYGWIVPGPALPSPGFDARAGKLTALRRVERFVEKPSTELANDLYHQGALWNTLAFSGSARSCWRLCAECLPEVVKGFASYSETVGTAREDAALNALFSELGSTNFSERVLTRAAPLLGVVECADVGWSDIGTPARVFESLKGTPEALLLEQRLAQQRSL
ncbi:MAG TPA: sugar phosphate nucleotidyltransferase [Polyangiaceae bacterium]|nr:sugar phosphate nucleotidyltransferase [Polyangiaceae bacterium]